MRVVVLLSCVVAALAQKEGDWKKQQAAWWSKVDDKCMQNTGPFRCLMNFSVGCQWHEDKGVCYNEDLWAQKLKEQGANTQTCKLPETEEQCKKLDGCEWHAPKEVCYDTEGFKKRQQTEAERGAGCWSLTDMDACRTRDDCVPDQGKCKVKGGCWASTTEDACAKNDKCTWIDDKNTCWSLGGFMKTGGKCGELGKAQCGNAMGCIWLMRPGGIGYCGRTDECRAQTSEDDCDKLGDDCYWVTLQWNNKSICRPNDGVQCGQQTDPDSCEAHSEACIWGERKGGNEGCMREDMINTPDKTPCIKAESKRECDSLSDDLNCGWTTQFGYGRELMGATGRCLHLDCAEIDTADMCEANWQCRWNARRATCVTDEMVHCDYNTQAQCLTQDECRWVWSENRDSYFCQSVCILDEVRNSAPLCRTFETCSWAYGPIRQDYTCRIAAASMDKTACISANSVDECQQYDDQGLGCFWDTDRNDCYHESCETYQNEDKCEGNYQCKWLQGRSICRSMQTWWCNGNDMEACEEAPSCKWVAFENREGRQVFGCRHECTKYETEEQCVNDDSCFYMAGRPVQNGERPGRWHQPGCRARAQDDDNSACAHQYNKKDCDSFAIAASVGCGWREGRQKGQGACVHEACYDYDQAEDCDKDKYCKWIRPMGRDGMCASPQAYWCKGEDKDSCEAAGRDCGWMQVGDNSDRFTCRHSCWAVKGKEECNSNDECTWGWNPKTKQGRCYFIPMNYDGGVMVDDACVDNKDEDSCLAAEEEENGCGWLETADFGEGGDDEGRMRQPGCRHIDCFQLDSEDTCEANLQCEWHGMRKECFSPIDYHCREIDDQIRCNALTGCAWNSREVIFPSGRTRFIESCTSSCKVIQRQQTCDLVQGCSWAKSARGMAKGRCMPDPEESLDQTWCNERGNQAECMEAPAKMGCVWQYTPFFKTSRCMHAACMTAETKDGCDAMDQCRWSAEGPSGKGKCYAPAMPTDENPCLTQKEDQCKEMNPTCVWALTQGKMGRCLLAPEDNVNDDGECNEKKDQSSCLAMAEKSQCFWNRARSVCMFGGCRNLLTKDKCMGQDKCEWVWRTAAQMAKFGKEGGSYGCRTKPFCDKETCKAPLCMAPGVYLDESVGCCGGCVPDDCAETDRQDKKSCKSGMNCQWNKKDKECVSKCPEITKEAAERECMMDGAMRAVISHPESGCDVARCVRPENYCATITSKGKCKKHQEQKLCEWKGTCIPFGGKVECEILGRKDCRAAKDDCVHVQALDKCMAVSTVCTDMTTKADCKALGKAHRKANKHFGGCNFDNSSKQCKHS